jgi:hypothetical protein
MRSPPHEPGTDALRLDVSVSRGLATRLQLAAEQKKRKSAQASTRSEFVLRIESVP